MLFGGFDDGLTDGQTDICTSWVAFATENIFSTWSESENGSIV